jgi:hypothetical protein
MTSTNNTSHIHNIILSILKQYTQNTHKQKTAFSFLTYYTTYIHVSVNIRQFIHCCGKPQAKNFRVFTSPLHFNFTELKKK